MDEPTIRYEDPWLLIVEKPYGWASQSHGDRMPSIYDHFARQRPYVGLHHRLDRPASGLLLLTLDPDVNPTVAGGFRHHAIRRTYEAILYGRTTDASWSRPLDGKDARTEVLPLHEANGFQRVRLHPVTGRKHQLRRHAALAGAPLVGDRRYGTESGRAWPRLALHATRLELLHPTTGEPLRIESPIPPDLLVLWKLAGMVQSDVRETTSRRQE